MGPAVGHVTGVAEHRSGLQREGSGAIAALERRQGTSEELACRLAAGEEGQSLHAACVWLKPREQR